MLKPFYSSVDMSEVELADNNLGPRVSVQQTYYYFAISNFDLLFKIPDPQIDDIRGNMINRTHGWKKVKVKIHMDVMVCIIE